MIQKAIVYFIPWICPNLDALKTPQLAGFNDIFPSHILVSLWPDLGLQGDTGNGKKTSSSQALQGQPVLE